MDFKRFELIMPRKMLEALKRLKKSSGNSIASLIRRAIDKLIKEDK